jgi:flagellar basal-body rod protein FlgB
MIEDRMFPTLENLLTLTSKRQQALSSNVANMDTPGYRAKDFSFEAELNAVNMSTTAANHITANADSGSNFRMFEVGTTEKPNGNTVDLERELTEITKNGLQYVTLVQYLNHKLRTIRSSITEGSKV